MPLPPARGRPRKAAAAERRRRRGRRWAAVGLAALLWPVWLQAQPATAPATQPAETVAVATARALEWVGTPLRETKLEAFAPAVDLRARVYLIPKPVRVWVARVDLNTPGLRFALTEPAGFTGDEAKFETRSATTLEFAQQRGVQLAVNTSAFGPLRAQTGQPMDVAGLAAVRGQVFSQPEKDFGALYVSRDGRVSLKGPPLSSDGVWHVVPGFRMLVDDGRVVVSDQEHQTKFGGVNPRTAVGTDRDGQTFWIVVADGRQPGVSEGLTLAELAALFQTLGAWDALNLDGGGSTALVAEHTDGTYAVLNTPIHEGKPGKLRQVAANLGLYLPGTGLKPRTESLPSFRDALVRLASGRRGGGFAGEGDGVSQDIGYDGEPLLRASGATHASGATFEVFLDAYCLVRLGCDASHASGRWFEKWPRDRFIAFQQGWYGAPAAAENPLLPEELRATVRQRAVADVLPWAGFGEAVADYRQLRRGDFVQFWRTDGTGGTAMFWGRDRDADGRERLWYWSSQAEPRSAPARPPESQPAKLAGCGLNWEYLGEELDPAQVFGVSPFDPAQP